MNRKAFAIIALLVLSYFGYLNFRFKKIEINNIDQPQIVTLVADNKNVNGLEAYIEGHLDDTAKINNIFLPAGKVKVQVKSGDCYVDTVRMIYKPYKAKSGVLTVKYRFKTN